MADFDLHELNAIDGYMASALVDADSGMMLASDGGGIDLEAAAAGNTQVVRAKRKTMASLGLEGGIHDILITLDDQYHIIRPLQTNHAVFLYLVLDRTRANLALARIALRRREQQIDLGSLAA